MKKLISTAFLVCLTGCATEYQKLGFSGGYQTMKLNDNMYSVEYYSNAWTSFSTNEHHALRRAAELAIEKGYRYFIVTNIRDFSSASTTPIVADTTIGARSASTVISGGHTTVSPGVQLTVIMLHNNVTGACDANAVLSNYPEKPKTPQTPPPTSQDRLKRIVGV